MNKRITSLLLSFVMIFAMLATAAPVSAEAAASTFTFTVEPDKTTAGPGDTVTFTVYIQQTGTMTCFAGKLGIPSGLTYVADSGNLTEGIQEVLGRDEVAWTQDPYKLLSAFGAEDFTGTDKIAVMKFQCTVDNDTAAGNYEVTLLEIESDGGSTEDYKTKNPTCIPATITVTAAPKPATGISLNKSELTLTVGAVDDSLTATVTPDDSTDTVVWSSDKPAVATVDSTTGKVTAVAPGEAVITAKAGEKKATCAVTVTEHICVHNPDKIEGREPTCTLEGTKEHYECTICGRLFEDAAATIEIKDYSSVVIPAKGHAYTEKNSDAAHKKSTAADCRAYDTYWYTCANDPAHNAKDDPEAADKFYNGAQGAHVFGTEWVNRGVTVGHAHKCLYDETYDAVCPHNPGPEATETEDQVCLDCNAVLVPRTGHVHANNLTPVAEKPATCTEDGTKAHYQCSCDKLFEDADANVEITNPDSIVIPAKGHDYTVQNSDEVHKKSTAADCREYDTYWYTCANDPAHSAKDDPEALDKFYDGAQGAHVFGTEWVDLGEEGHAHKCKFDDAYDEVQPHTPDHEGHATYDYAINCSDCGRVMEEQLVEGMIRVEVPFKLTIKKTGEMDPGKETFQFAPERFGAEGGYVIIKDTVETNGAKTYEGSFVLSVRERDIYNFSEGFIFHQIKGNAQGWTYDEAKFYVVPQINFDNDTPVIAGWEFYTFDERFDDDKKLDELTFTNSYYAKKPEKPATTPETKKPDKPKSPKTGDNNSFALWIALLFVSGIAVAGPTFACKKKKF